MFDMCYGINVDLAMFMQEEKFKVYLTLSV